MRRQSQVGSDRSPQRPKPAPFPSFLSADSPRGTLRHNANSVSHPHGPRLGRRRARKSVARAMWATSVRHADPRRLLTCKTPETITTMRTSAPEPLSASGRVEAALIGRIVQRTPFQAFAFDGRNRGLLLSQSADGCAMEPNLSQSGPAQTKEAIRMPIVIMNSWWNTLQRARPNTALGNTHMSYDQRFGGKYWLCGFAMYHVHGVTYTCSAVGRAWHRSGWGFASVRKEWRRARIWSTCCAGAMGLYATTVMGKPPYCEGGADACKRLDQASRLGFRSVR
jgi:hypothetical protein